MRERDGESPGAPSRLRVAHNAAGAACQLAVRPALNTRAVDRVVVIGLAVEVAVAALVAADVLTRDPLKIAAHEMTFPTSESRSERRNATPREGSSGFAARARRSPPH
jgi:hypothetical protein